MDDAQPPATLAQHAIKKVLKEVEWWNIVQDEVKKALFIIIDNIDTLGLPFLHAFIASCELEYHRRKLLQQDGDKGPSIIFGSKLTEERYQSAIGPVRSLLGLDDWFNPGEADVQSCYLICDHIKILQQLNVFNLNENLNEYVKILEQLNENGLNE